MNKIPVAGPWITKHEIDYVTDAVSNAWFGNANMYNERFERAFADRIRVRYAMALPSCTSGIHLALSALGIGPGDEVIVPEITWIASAAPISYVGATPVFADVDPETWCICPDSVEASIGPRTKAVIAVDLYGNMANYDRLVPLAKQHGLQLIEDAAEAVGATYRGRPAGSFGDAAVFSFHGSKTLTTGEGGMLVTQDQQLFDRASFLRDHGRVPGDFSFQNSEVAFKYKMSSMQAALGLAQLERVDELIKRKRQIFHWYAERLADVPGVRINTPGPEVCASYWMVSIVWGSGLDVNKHQIRDCLNREGIDSRPFFSPLSSLGAYENTASARQCSAKHPVAYRLGDFGINLPSHLLLREDEVNRVCEVVRRIFLHS